MRRLLIAMFMLLGSTIAARAEVQVGISIGINVPVYPNLVVVPGYPVYYDPDLDSNYFFYDGQYWIYDDDNWYASSWYNGPWTVVEPEYVPVFVLRVPVRYYHRPPPYFAGWQRDAPPRWGEHWGGSWQQRHAGWDHWDRRAVPHAAPLPVYQRQYSGDRYPREVAQQHAIRAQNYHYQSRDPVVQRVQQRDSSDNARGQSRSDSQPQRSSRQQPAFQQRSVAQPQVQQTEQSQRQNESRQRQSAPARSPAAPAAQQRPAAPNPRPQAESRDRGRDNAPAAENRGRDKDNNNKDKDREERGDDRR